MFKIVSDDNTDAASFSILESRGYQLKREINSENGIEYDVAETKDSQFWGLAPTDILGLIQLYEQRGENWEPNRQENERFDEFDEARRRERNRENEKEVFDRLTRPKFLTSIASTMIVAGLRAFTMLIFATFYFHDLIKAEALRPWLTWLALPLALFGLWKGFDAFGKLIDNYFEKIPEQEKS